MVDNAIPSRDPVNEGTLTGTFKEVLKKFLQSTDDMLPAKIVEYDRATNRAKVQPLIQVLTTNGDNVTRGTIASIPVLLIGGGDFFVSFNLPVDSLGWIKASDRDLSLFLQTYEENPPNTVRLHEFSDSIFIPDIMRGYTINAEDDEAMVIQNLDGTVRISLNDSRIKMTSPLVEITATDVNITGDLTATGTITGTTEVVGNGISLSTHTHGPGTYTAGGDAVIGSSATPS